jgi:hypothetical protein
MIDNKSSKLLLFFSYLRNFMLPLWPVWDMRLGFDNVLNIIKLNSEPIF